MGLDEESMGHRIYWADKCIVTIEQSVNFLPEDVEIMVKIVLLKGKDEKLDERDVEVKETVEHPISPTQSTKAPKTKIITEAEDNEELG